MNESRIKNIVAKIIESISNHPEDWELEDAALNPLHNKKNNTRIAAKGYMVEVYNKDFILENISGEDLRNLKSVYESFINNWRENEKIRVFEEFENLWK